MPSCNGRILSSLRLGLGGIAHEGKELADLKAKGGLNIAVAAMRGDEVVAKQRVGLTDAVRTVFRLRMHGG